MYKKFVHAHVTIKAALLLTYLHVLTYLLIYQCIYIYIYISKRGYANAIICMCFNNKRPLDIHENFDYVSCIIYL